jgi:hypothetical protein
MVGQVMPDIWETFQLPLSTHCSSYTTGESQASHVQIMQASNDFSLTATLIAFSQSGKL